MTIGNKVAVLRPSIDVAGLMPRPVHIQLAAGGFVMSGFGWRRGAFVFVAFMIIGPSLSYFGRSLTENGIILLLVAAAGGALSAVVGLSIENFLVGRKV